jgi:glycerophosphoryl diester phosphodiesterase
MAQKRWSRDRVEVIAHRGHSSLAPENTLAALGLAIRSGAHRVEFDVQLTKDGVPVVLHDETLERTTNGKGRLCDTTYREISKLDAGSWFHPRFEGEQVPALDGALELCKGKIPVNVEIKCADASGFIEKKVVDALRRHDSLDSATVSSFEAHALERVRRLDPRITRETLYNDPRRPPGPKDLRLAKDCGSAAFSVSLEELIHREELLEEAHALGLGLKVYTVDDLERFRKLLFLGVDGVFTNRPDALLSVLKETQG